MRVVVVRRGTARRPGAVAARCAVCAAECWCAADNAGLVEQGAPAVCMTCAAEAVARSPEAPRLALTPEAAKRLAKRKRRFARRHGVRVEDVGHWPPVELGLAIDTAKRRN